MKKQFYSMVLFLGLGAFLFPVFAQSGFDTSHKAFTDILQAHIKQGKVSYSTLQNDRSKLLAYLKTLESVTPETYRDLPEKDKIAFLINAYNAFTLELILQNYPIESIGDIGGMFRKWNLANGKPWKTEFFQLLGKKRHLDWIEHEKLRKDFSEPRIHFAINCASIGCPALRNQAYQGSQLDQQLEEATKGFLLDKSKNRYDAKAGKLYLSPIFQWFESDFTKKSTVIRFVKPYLGETALTDDTKIEYTRYDWNLNDIK